MTPASAPPVETRPAEIKPAQRNPWNWIPTLYLAEGLPYVVVMYVSVIMYKGLGISNTDIALYTSWLYLPWVIKPLWSPVVDLLKTRRMWIWVMQLIIGASFAGIALTIPTVKVFQYSLAFLALLAFSSATHDIAADGFYMLATTEKEQSFFVGIRSTFYRISMISGQGLLVILAGIIQSNIGLPQVEINVSATPGATTIHATQPERVITDFGTGELRVLVSQPSVEISPEPRSQQEIGPLIAAAKEENFRNGLYESAPNAPELSSWWSRLILRPIKQFFAVLGRALAAPFR